MQYSLTLELHVFTFFVSRCVPAVKMLAQQEQITRVNAGVVDTSA